MSREELLQSLNIDKSGREENGIYTIYLEDDNEYFKMSTKLESNDEIVHNTEFKNEGDMVQSIYKSENYEIKLIGDLANDKYRIEIKEI